MIDHNMIKLNIILSFILVGTPTGYSNNYR